MLFTPLCFGPFTVEELRDCAFPPISANGSTVYHISQYGNGILHDLRCTAVLPGYFCNCCQTFILGNIINSGTLGKGLVKGYTIG